MKFGKLIVFVGVGWAACGFGRSEECYRKLTVDYTKDSTSYGVKADLEDGINAMDGARELIERALKKAGCEVKQVKIEEIVCKEIVPSKLHTNVCYATADLGYFFVAKDMLDTANVIFNRWD
jgi:hypothetical protein